MKQPAAPVPQTVSMGNSAPQWANYVTSNVTAAQPNFMWQGTTSGATYATASSVLNG